MCGVCGCSDGESRIDGVGSEHRHNHAHTHHGATCEHAHEHGHTDGGKTTRLVEIEKDILSRNQVEADSLRVRFAHQEIFALNILSSPGSGKTTLLVSTVSHLNAEGHSIAVLEGDQETSNDADRIKETGVDAVQINTGRGCHLDAGMVDLALDKLSLPIQSTLFIENVGNLVCPAAFDLGEDYRVVILSVTEGEDKPLKYPDMFATADVLLITKIDLLPYVPFDVDQAIEYARRVNPDVHIMQISALTGAGMDVWNAWIKETASRKFRASEDHSAKTTEDSFRSHNRRIVNA